MNNVNGLLSIARKAGYVIIGQDNLTDYKKKLYLVLMDKNAGNSLSREMNFLAKKDNIPLLQVDDLEKLVSIKNCKAVGIKNKAISDKIIESLKKGE